MIVGIGIDIVEIYRVKDIMERQDKFVDRILVQSEKQIFDQLEGHRQTEYLAGRFAAKEAFAKALGTGIGREVTFKSIEVKTDQKGKPYIENERYHVHLSISHSREYAVANVVIEQA